MSLFGTKKKDISDSVFYSRLARSFATTAKQLLWIIVFNSIIWIYCSYVLAFLGKEQIAETLSSNICSVLLGQIISYFISKTVENVFQYNNIGGQSTFQQEDIPVPVPAVVPNIIVGSTSTADTTDTSTDVVDTTNHSDGTTVGIDPTLNPGVSTEQNVPEDSTNQDPS